MNLWPEYDRRTVYGLGSSIMSQRWAVATPSGAWPRRIPQVEVELAKKFRCKHALTVCNGSAALLLSMQALGIRMGNRVLLPAFTWVGCITAVLRLGAIPVLCDTEHMRLTAQMVSPIRPDIDAILAIPLYAQTVDMKGLRSTYPHAKIICDLSHLICSPALGDPLEYGDLLISSFQASKALTCGEGGFIGTNDMELAKRIEALRTDGRVLNQDTLEPFGTVHGANYAMSEITAGLLLDQIDRLEDQRSRRAAGGQFFLERLRKMGVPYHADDATVDGGLHYGIPVELHEPPIKVIDNVFSQTGVLLDSCYPAIMHGPLCCPFDEPRYQNIDIPIGEYPNTLAWHDKLVLVPQEVLLEDDNTLSALACCLAGKPLPKMFIRDMESPDITVIIVTDGTRTTLQRAVLSVIGQEYGGLVKVLVVCDRCDNTTLPLPDHQSVLEILRIDLDDDIVISRVAKLRDLALRLCTTELVCFLDDDNSWTPNHLEELNRAMQRKGTPAAHCWRQIRNKDGQPWDASHFPWLEMGTLEERKEYNKCCISGIITEGDSVFRDSAEIEGAEGVDVGIVDLGTWLIRTDVLRLFGLTACRDGALAPEEGIGEDDILLSQLRAAQVPIACSRQPTLEYLLGGFSNEQLLRKISWGKPI